MRKLPIYFFKRLLIIMFLFMPLSLQANNCDRYDKIFDKITKGLEPIQSMKVEKKCLNEKLLHALFYIQNKHGKDYERGKKLISYLLKIGADINSMHEVKYGDEYPIIFFAISSGFGYRKDVGNNYMIDLIDFLIKNGADINKRAKNGTYIIHHFIQKNVYNKMLLKYFLEEKGFDVNIKGNYGKTPLHVAASNYRIAMAQYLIGNGADINAVDLGGKTVMHVIGRDQGTMELATLPMVKLLISQGAKINAIDKSGYTPLDYIKKKPEWDGLKSDVIKFFKENGGF